MRNRWGILAVLFAVRATMAFQFQSVAAVAPLLGNEFGVSIADIGVLIGLYFAPGIVFALPGGAIGQRFGDKRTVLGALAADAGRQRGDGVRHLWNVQIAGRLVTGIGGVILSVQLTKMLTDWFAGKEIATAMAIFVNSWPAGIAVSLLTLPLIGTSSGVGAVHLAVAAFIAFGVVLLALFYQPPPDAPRCVDGDSARLDRSAALAVIAAGLIWGLFNVGFAVIFSFGPSMLVERGWSIAVGRIGAEHRVVDRRVLRPVRRMAGGPHRPAANHPGHRRPRVRRADDPAAAHRRGHRDHRRAWPRRRPARRPDHEPARPRAAARHPRDRHGPVLHDVLRLHDAGPGGRRRVREVEPAVRPPRSTSARR